MRWGVLGPLELECLLSMREVQGLYAKGSVCGWGRGGFEERGLRA